MPVIISSLISALAPVLKDNLSKHAGGATILFMIYQAVKKLAETLYNDFGISAVYVEWGVWISLVLVLLFAPADWMKSRIALFKLAFQNLGRK